MKYLEKRKQYMKEFMKKRRKDSKFKKTEVERKKSYYTNYKNSNPEKKFKNCGKRPLQHTESQILRILRLRNHVKKPITWMPIHKKLRNLEGQLLWHAEN